MRHYRVDLTEREGILVLHGDFFLSVGLLFLRISEGDSLFVCGDPEARIVRLMARHGFSQKEAADYMHKRDKRRRSYHNENCTGNWGDAVNYHLCVSSTPLGIDGTVDLLEHYIRMRINKD